MREAAAMFLEICEAWERIEEGIVDVKPTSL